MLEINSILNSPKSWSSIVEIFFESSAKKTFVDDKQKRDFLFKYLGFYKENYPEYFFIASDGDHILGYICGSPHSLTDKDLYQLLPHYSLFEDLYLKFPAHLHINLSSHCRGLGVGSKLLAFFEDKCSAGVHLITGPKARNRSFYLKNNYTYESTREFNGLELHFMGKTL